MRVFLLLLSLQMFCVSGNTDIQFAGFVPNTVYTYYTNGVNTHTQLTCGATSDSYTDISATWIVVTGNEDTGSSVLSFVDIATEVVLGYQGDYLCRAVYQTDPEMLYQDSDSITVRIKYNATITVSYGDTTHIRDIENTDYVYISVMTEDVVISCDADMALWYYTPTGLSYQTNVTNPITIELFTIQYAIGYICTVRSNQKVNVNIVTLKSYGSGVYRQQQDTYTRLTEGESIHISEDTTLVCVTSTFGSTQWYYRGTSTTGIGERIIEEAENIRSKAFLTLSLQTTSRVGNYYCQTKEVTENTYRTVDIKHSIIVSVPIIMSTTSIPTTPMVTTPMPTISIQTTPIDTTSITTTTELVIQQTTQTTAKSTRTATITTERNDQAGSEVPPLLYPIIGAAAGVLVILTLVITVVILVIAFVMKRRRSNRSGYTKHNLTNNTEDTTTSVNNNNNKYVNLQELPVSQVPPPKNKKPVYKKLVQTDTPITNPIKSPSEDTHGYMTLDQLEGSLGGEGESDPCVEEKIVPGYGEEVQYENVQKLLYESTTAKYSHDPYAALVPLSQFKSHLSHLLSGSRLENEYRRLGEQVLRYECTHARRSENTSRNKYKQIYPYDNSRVVLTSNRESDYINASYIPGFYVSETFIVSQGPKENTETHFWQMILEQRVSTVVMLTRVVELGKEKCTSYWPQEVGSSSEFEGIKVTLKRENKSACYVIREMEVRAPNSSSYRLTQFHYVAWPDHDVPQLFVELLDFTQMIKKHQRGKKRPPLVHCSAGVGRSGTFIALYNLLEAVGVGETISVYRIVNEMREHRPQMVQTFNQYRFIYLSVLEMIFGMTGIPNNDFCDTYKLYLHSQGESGDVLKEQFDEICYQSDCSFTYPQEAALNPINASKNAIKEVLPYDTNRVILYSANWPCEYINASYMGSYEMIVTMLPTQETIQDFLQLVYQLEDPLVVLLFTQNEYQKLRSGVTNRVCYWLEERGKKEFGEFSTTTEKSQKSPSFIQQKMTVYSNHDNYERSFSQFISLVWEETGAVNDAFGLLTLLDSMAKFLTSPGKKIVFCCNDGIGKSGVLMTLYRTVREMDTENCIDVFQTVKRIRSFRKNMVPTLEHYISCYHLINEYCQMNL